MPAPEAHRPIPLNQAPAGHPFVVERITEEAEADRQLLRFLWESGIRPGSRIVVSEIAPYAGTVSIVLDGRTVTMGLSASNKIWVYDPMEPEPAARPKAARARRPVKSRA
jgi:Fe2+ transport system protein FeoA